MKHSREGQKWKWPLQWPWPWPRTWWTRGRALLVPVIEKAKAPSTDPCHGALAWFSAGVLATVFMLLITGLL